MSEQNTLVWTQERQAPVVGVDKNGDSENVDVATVLRYAAEVHPQEDFVHDDMRNLNKKCERRHKWFCSARRSDLEHSRRTTDATRTSRGTSS